MKSPLDERPRLNKRGSKLALLFFVLCFFEKHCVASLQLKGSLSISSASILSSSGSLKDCYLSIRSTTFLSSPALLRADFLDESTSLPSIHLPSRNSMITMAKGDGKQKRKKQTPSSSPAPALPAQPNAPRVSTDINISIRRQIAYGKLNKQMRAGGATSFRQAKKVRTKFRKTWNETEIAQKAEERKRKGQDPDWDVILNRTSTSPLIIVDGYNVIYQWPRLKKHMMKGDTARARQLLLEDLESLRSIKGWRIEVVFDGAGRNPKKGPLGDTRQRVSSADRASSKEVSKFGVRAVYTGSGIEADSYIEARCAEAKSVTDGAITGSFIVATDDVMIRLAGLNAGALCMSSDRLVSELKAVKKSMAYRVEVAMAKVNGDCTVRPEKLWGTNIFSSSNTVRRNPTVSEEVDKKNNNNSKARESSTAKENNDLPIINSGMDRVQKTEDGLTIYTDTSTASVSCLFCCKIPSAKKEEANEEISWIDHPLYVCVGTRSLQSTQSCHVEVFEGV